MGIKQKFQRLKLQLDQIIHNLYYVLFFITPLFMYSQTSEIFEFNKMMFIYLTTIVIVFCYILHLFFCKERFYKHLYYIPFVIFIISQFLSTVFSIDLHTSFFGYYGRWNGGFLSILSYFTLFFICVQMFTYEKVLTLLRISLLSSLLVILWGIPGLFGMDVSCRVFTGTFTNECWTQDFDPAIRMFSTIGQPNWLGAYLVIHFFIAAYFWLKTIPEKYNIREIKNSLMTARSYVFSSYLLLNLMAVYSTKSRSAWIALIVGILLGGMLIIPHYFSIKKRVLWLTGRLILGILLILIAFGLSKGWFSQLYTLPTQTTQITDSFDIRKVVWKGALDLGNRNPILGTGPETFAYSYYFTRPREHNLTSEWDFIYNKAHNEFFNYIATSGYVGFLTYMSLIIATYILFVSYLRYLNEKKRFTLDAYLLSVMLLMSYTSILITNFFGFSVSEIQLFFYLVPALFIVLMKKEKIHAVFPIKSMVNDSIQTKIAIGSLCILFIGSLFLLHRYYLADMTYAQGRQALESDQNQEAASLLTQAMRYKYEHVYEDKLSSALANLAYEHSLQKNTSFARNLIQMSDKANLNTIEQSSQNILYWKTRGKNYYMYYQVTHDEDDLFEAIRSMEQVMKIAPTDVQSKYTLALFYWIISNEIQDKKTAANYANKAKTTLQEVIRMKPNYIEAKELLESI